MTLEEAIQFLRPAVKESAVEGQKHIDPTLVNADKLEQFHHAMMITRQAVAQEEISEEDLRHRLGLI